MAAKKASGNKERDDAWWEAQRHAYIAKNSILDGAYDWQRIDAYDFYRTIFPSGFLETKGVMLDWNEPGGGKPNAMMIQITNQMKTVETKSGEEREVPIVERYTVTDDLAAIDEQIADADAKNEALFCAPVSYFGKERTARNARYVHAIAIDLDGVGLEQLQNILKQIRNGYDAGLPGWTSLPQPTFLVNSGTGVHLYYVLKTPVPLKPKYIPFMQKLKEQLTDYVWRDTTSSYKTKQYQGIYQAFRVPGSPTKLNGHQADSKKVQHYEAVAYAHYVGVGDNRQPFKCDLSYLLGFAGTKDGMADYDELLKLNETAGKTPLPKAKELWPEWYQTRIVEGQEMNGRWTCNRALYDWWLGQIEQKASDKHRYWCLYCLAAYAAKCGVSEEELERDALALVPYFESLTERDDNHFTAEHALAACAAYRDPIIHKLSIRSIERRTAIDIPRSKRNGRPQELHLKGARAIQAINDEFNGTNWRDGNGRKPKKDLVRNYALAHPGENHSQIARALGVSRPTVIKWLKED